ncbi:MAG: hypothetical protein HOI64_05990 [Rhodobiaceae bacterium]|nr:hypothetical protein [Rhodobiaceae bacterium]
MKKYNPQIIIFLIIPIISCFLFFSTNSKAANKVVTKIIVLVNDSPITYRDYSERAKYNQFISPKKTLKQIESLTIKELVNEMLKRQEAIGSGITVPDSQVRATLKNMLSESNETYESYKILLDRNNIDIKTYEEQVKVSLLWGKFINFHYRKFINITQDNINEFTNEVDSNTTYDIKKITLKKTKTKTINDLLKEATLVNFKFKNCEENLIDLEKKDYIDIIRIPSIRLSGLEEPIKSMVKFGRENTMLPPNVTKENIKLIAICNIANSAKNINIENTMRAQQLRNFENKHLRDLSQDSIIEFKIND